MKDRLVSVIMPAFNCEKFIGEAIESVQSQSYSEFELLICDDGSTDNTFAQASKYAQTDPRVKIFKNRFAKGAAGARNTSISMSSGRYIAFLDADDFWRPEKLAKQLDFMRANNVHFSYTYYNSFSFSDSSGVLVKSPPTVSLKKMRYSNFIGCLTVIIDRTNVKHLWQPDIKKRNDFALWLTILRENKSIRTGCLPISLAYYRVNNYGLSSNISDSIHYFNKCLIDYSGVTKLEAFGFLLIYLVLTFIKKKAPNFHNFFVSKV